MLNLLEGTVAGNATMSSFLDTLGQIVTKMFAWVTEVGGAIIGDPILTFSLGVFAVGEDCADFKSRKKTGNLKVSFA